MSEEEIKRAVDRLVEQGVDDIDFGPEPPPMKRLSPEEVMAAVGTSLKGYVSATYDVLVNLFGEPGPGDGYKTDVDWAFRLPSGGVMTIYNWKNGPAYLGRGGTPVEQISFWNVSGSSAHVDEIFHCLDDRGLTFHPA